MSTRRSRFLALGLLAAACAGEAPGPGEPDEAREVRVTIDDLVAISHETSTGTVTVLRDRETDRELAMFEWDDESGAALLSLVERQTSLDVHIEDNDAPTLDTAHEYAAGAYAMATDEFRLWGWHACCWWGDYSECGFAWEPGSGGTVCCGWCGEPD